MQKPVRYHITEVDDRPVVQAVEADPVSIHGMRSRSAPHVDEDGQPIRTHSKQVGPRLYRPVRLPVLRLPKS